MKRFILFSLFVLFFVTSVSAIDFPLSRGEPCPTDELFQRARTMALKIPVTHSTESATYRRIIIHGKSSTIQHPTDFVWRTIPLVLLNQSTCELVATTITRRIRNGDVPTLLSADDGPFLIYIEPRPQGTLWNWWNTPLQVLAPDNWIVAAVHWKHYSTGESIAYTPGSADLMNAFPSLVEIGRYHIRGDTEEAYGLLRFVGSHAIPSLTVPDVMRRFFPHLIETIISIEQADDHEVEAYRTGAYAINPIDRPFAVIGANPERAYAYTRSKAGARGLLQIMPGTCRDIHTEYRPPISASCMGIEHSHPEEIAAAMLVFDYHLSLLMKNLRKPGESREAFAERPQIEIMLRASYNTGPSRVSRLVRQEKNWTARLLKETRGYLLKAKEAVKEIVK